MNATPVSQRSVRAIGLMRFLTGTALTAAILLFFQWRASHSAQGHVTAVLWGLPGAWAIAGLIEMITGVHIMELSARWDSMAQWKQTVYGLLLMALGFLLIAGVIVTYIHFSE